MRKREFWQIEPVQVDSDRGKNQRPMIGNGCLKTTTRVVLFACLFTGLSLFYLLNWGFDKVAESSSQRYSATAYFYAPWTYEGDIALWIYDEKAPEDKVISLGVVNRHDPQSATEPSLDSAYWSQDESIIIVYVMGRREVWPDGREPFTGYDLNQHKVLTPKDIPAALKQRGGRGREIAGHTRPFHQEARARRFFENYPMRTFIFG